MMVEKVADFQIQVNIEPVLREGTLGYSFFSCYETLDYKNLRCGPITYKTIKIVFDQILQELSQIIETQSLQGSTNNE